MKVFFRTDSSLEIGSGHVMRCLTLAKALREHGAACHFICRAHAGYLGELIKEQGFPVVLLEAESPLNDAESGSDTKAVYRRWLGAPWEVDVAETIATIGAAKPDWIVADHYGIDHQWEASLRPHCKKIMVIDDLANRPHACDLLLDQNLIENLENRYKSLLPEGCACLLGPAYALLQAEYAAAHRRTPPRLGSISRILVYFGGADRRNLTGSVIEAFLKLGRKDVVLDVVLNSKSPHNGSIRQLAANADNVVLHENLPSLCDLMISADICIGASGATSWERCCLGLPTYVVTLAENQVPIAKGLDQGGFARWIGSQAEITVDSLESVLTEAFGQQDGLMDWSSLCRTLVDGKGTERVASVMMLNKDSPLRVRQAEVRDEQLLLDWANDPLVRKNACNSNTIEPETHRKWFYKRLREPAKCQIFIVEAEDGLPIGQVRFESTGGAWEIHYRISSIARSLHLELPILSYAIGQFRDLRNDVTSFSIVKNDELSTDFSFGTSDLGGGCTRSNLKPLTLAVCSQRHSWINKWIPELLLTWLLHGHQCSWTHSADDLIEGDICFYLSYERIVNSQVRSKFRNNLVVHASDLPEGRGWSPTSWLILRGDHRIPVTLLEAIDEVDAGKIYAQSWFDLEETDLIEDWRKKLAAHTIALVKDFVDSYPDSSQLFRLQSGKPTFFPRRRPKDSELNLEKSLREQFNLLRVVDNESYPAFVRIGEKKIFLKVYVSNIDC